MALRRYPASVCMSTRFYPSTVSYFNRLPSSIVFYSNRFLPIQHRWCRISDIKTGLEPAASCTQADSLHVQVEHLNTHTHQIYMFGMEACQPISPPPEKQLVRYFTSTPTLTVLDQNGPLRNERIPVSATTIPLLRVVPVLRLYRPAAPRDKGCPVEERNTCPSRRERKR